MKRIITALLCIAMILSLAACGDKKPKEKGENEQSYGAVFAVVSELQSKAEGDDPIVWNGRFAKNAAVDDMAVEYAAESESVGSDYSDTNVQVEGIDEGDIVKTDGEYIYSIYCNTLKIYRADGANTALVSSTEINSEKDLYISEMYVSGDKLILIGSEYELCIDYEEGYRGEYTPPTAKALIYDVTDRSTPSYVNYYGQDGSLVSSRLMDGELYLVSSYGIWTEAVENKPETYIPRTYCDDKAELVPTDSICIMPEANSTVYTVLTKLNLSDGANESLSVLGASDIVYMSKTALYTAACDYSEEASEEYREDNYTVTDYEWKTETRICKLDLGSMTAAATATVPGYIESQFSMDEYNGCFRIVTTVQNSRWSEYVDEKYGFVNTECYDVVSSTGLYVFDSSLNQLAAIEGLAEDEYVRSVRFDGDFVYFCTFRQTDPLFAVDVSEADSPRILSEYKISGFSEYLHSWSEGLLFGLGMEADEETGATDGIKLVMFDVSDKADVKAKHTLKLDSTYSDALYDHHALLISSEKGIIGFPTENGFELYCYSEENGFEKLASVNLSDDWNQTRGMYIGEFAYVVGESGVDVLDMQSFELLTTVR